MKKTVMLIISLVLAALISCNAFYQQDDYKTIMKKTTYKSFDSLNEPIVLNYLFDMYFTQKGENPQTSIVHNGMIYAVYDWEKNEIFDYVYAPGNGTRDFSNCVNPCLKGSDGKLTYYGSDSGYQRLYVMRSDKTELDFFDSADKDSYYGGSGFAGLSEIRNGKGLRYYCDKYDNGEYYLRVKTFSPESNSFAKTVTMKAGGFDFYDVPAADPEGNFWFIFDSFDDETQKSYSKICKFDVQKNAFAEPLKVYEKTEGAVYDEMNGWNFIREYKILSADSGFLYVTERKEFINKLTGICESRLFRVEKATGLQSEITGAELTEESMTFAKNINGTVYVFLRDDVLLNTKVYRVEGETTLSDTNLSFKDDILSNMEVRGEKVFVISCNDPTITITCVDLKENKVSEPESISLKDFYN